MFNKGSWHLPVIAFVLGGMLSIQKGYSLYFLFLLFIIWLFSYHRHPVLIFILLLFGIGGYVHLSPQPLPVVPPLQQNSYLEGVIISPVKKTDHFYSFIMKTKDASVLVRYPLQEQSRIPDSWNIGASCRGEGEAELFDQSRNPGQFNYRSYMEKQGVFYQWNIDKLDSLQCNGDSWMTPLFKKRSELRAIVQQNVRPEAYIWISALVFGDTSHIDQDTIDWFREFNLSHILAISGLHIGLTMGGTYFVLYRSGAVTKKQAKLLLIILLPIYMFISGGAPSVMRAGLMGILLLVCGLFRLKISLLDLLSLTCLFMLFFSPSHFFHLGFQFSFLVTTSLLLTLPILKEYESKWTQSAVVGLISQLSLLALQVHYFFEFQPFSLWMNLFAVPYFSFFVIPSLMFIFIACFVVPSISSLLSQGFMSIHEPVLKGLMEGAEMLDYPWVTGEIPVVFVLLYGVFFVLMMKEWELKQRGRAFAVSLILVFILALCSSVPYFSNKGVVTMLDVGQGDTFIIELPYRKGVIMMDAAGPPMYVTDKEKTAANIILPFLKSRGIHKLDALFISHADSDHSGSVPFILKEMNVDRIYVSPFYKETFENNGKVERLGAGKQIIIGGVMFRVIHPLNNVDHGNPNDNSLVVSVDLGGKRWLYTGDISARIEKDIIKRGDLEEAEILKVAHHGSNTSSSVDFLRKVNPEVGLISAGVENRYGHPHGEVIDSLEAHGVALLETNRYGAVQYTFFGQSGTFSTFLPYNASRE